MDNGTYYEVEVGQRKFVLPESEFSFFNLISFKEDGIIAIPYTPMMVVIGVLYVVLLHTLTIERWSPVYGYLWIEVVTFIVPTIFIFWTITRVVFVRYKVLDQPKTIKTVSYFRIWGKHF